MAEKFSIFGEEMTTLLGVLNAALDGKGSIVIRASKRGLSVALNGRLLASAKTPLDLHHKIKAGMTQAIKDLKQKGA